MRTNTFFLSPSAVTTPASFVQHNLQPAATGNGSEPNTARFCAADLWNIRKMKKTRVQRRNIFGM